MRVSMSGGVIHRVLHAKNMALTLMWAGVRVWWGRAFKSEARGVWRR